MKYNPECLSNKEKNEKFSLKKIISLSAVLSIVKRLTKIEIDEDFNVKKLGIKIKSTNFLSLEEGRLHYEKEEWDPALEKFLKSVTVKTDDHRALYNVGITMMKMGEHLKEPAKYFAQKALEFHPCEEYEEFIATFNDHLPKNIFCLYQYVKSDHHSMI